MPGWLSTAGLEVGRWLLFLSKPKTLAKNTTRIALVDDHTLIRNGLATVVNSFEKYSVLFEASNGKDFIEQLKKYSTPDIVLLDINMPEMNGIDTALWIKDNLPAAK